MGRRPPVEVKEAAEMMEVVSPEPEMLRVISADVVDHIIAELTRHFRQSEDEIRVAYRQREDRLLASFVAAQVKIRELGG